ncbi:MAG: vWA domain-containing protein [Chthoniobacterales bacterium]
MKTAFYLCVLSAALAAPCLSADPIVDLTVTPDREAVHPKSGRDTILQVEITARPSTKKRTTPLNLTLVLDRSGSMRGAKLEKARQAACAALRQLGKDDIFSLVTYDDNVEVLIPPQKNRDRDELEAKINSIEPGGSTALYAGVKTGAAELRKFIDDEHVNRIVLLSDGLANSGPSSPRELARLGVSLREEGISVSTVGLGDDYNEDLMTALAEASRANYYYVRDVEKLPGIFKEELGVSQSIVARKMDVVLKLAEGVEPRGVLGESGMKFEGNTLRIPIEDLAAGQKRRFLVACRVPAGAKDSIKLAEAKLEYSDAESGTRLAANATAKVRIAATDEESDRTVVRDVAVNAAITGNRLAKEQAVRLVDEGRPLEAASLLLKQAAANCSLPAVAHSSLLDSETENITLNANYLNENGNFTNVQRKEFQLQNYQDRNQKR